MLLLEVEGYALLSNLVNTLFTVMQHSYIANGLGGANGLLVVDLSELKDITVDLDTGIATIGTGNRLGDIVLALNEYGLGLPHGRCNSVGIGGHSGVFPAELCDVQELIFY